MLPKSDPPGQFYGTAKTQEFTNINEITKDNLKFRPSITQTRAYTYNAAQVIAKYLRAAYIIISLETHKSSLCV